MTTAGASWYVWGMARKSRSTPGPAAGAPAPAAQRPSALVDTRVIYCGDNLEQLHRLPDGCVDLIYTDPPYQYRESR